jgi:hypothetical protein
LSWDGDERDACVHGRQILLPWSVSMTGIGSVTSIKFVAPSVLLDIEAAQGQQRLFRTH